MKNENHFDYDGFGVFIYKSGAYYYFRIGYYNDADILDDVIYDSAEDNNACSSVEDAEYCAKEYIDSRL